MKLQLNLLKKKGFYLILNVGQIGKKNVFRLVVQLKFDRDDPSSNDEKMTNSFNSLKLSPN